MGTAQVMGVARLAATDQTGLLGDVSDVLAIPDPARLRKCEQLSHLVDDRGWPALPGGGTSAQRSKSHKLGAKALFDALRIGVHQRALLGKPTMGPESGIIYRANLVHFRDEPVTQLGRRFGTERGGE